MESQFDYLYETYHQSLFQFIFYMVRNRETAEELVQEVYIKVLQSYESFEGNSSEKTWLYSIARHVAIDWIRMQNRQKRKWLGMFSPIEKEIIRDSAPLPDEVVTQREEIRQIYKGLQQCSVDQQQVIILRYIQSLSIAETAQILGWTDSKVKTTQHRAIKALKDIVEHPNLAEVKEG
ncbi:RNA polymerase sigma factor SigX [Bacillus alkalicellulosilyticus]|uniref:RNA polymerase sigma factor SigX n=1 Tax=Alkalihalobacterium alkalicellulosilyticum TaxID=1912214 RepID=UPI000996218D|nr:RNA polymerase sigma factor SigX [Bacillus alkalicellulosilyticus]